MQGRRLRSLLFVLAAAALAAVAVAATTQQSAAPPSALALQNAYHQVVKTVSPSVVQVQTSAGLGSGVVFDAKGNIVTNAHVVGDATRFRVTTSGGKQLDAKLVGKFTADDLAVVHVNAKLRPAVFADSSKLQVGDLAIAIGNPLGLRSSVTDGIVSALGRTPVDPEGGAIPGAIQTSAPINPGNSGGALADIRGRVIGIPTLGATDPNFGGTAPGIGFAIPSNLVKNIASQLIRNGKVVNSGRAYLGIQVGDTSGQGVYVGAVTAGGPAAKAGMRVGDVIVSVAGKSTPTTDELSSVLVRLKPGQKVAVVVQRQDGSRATLHVTLGEYPGS